MSIYLQNLNSNIDATINRGGITFRQDNIIVDMVCRKIKTGFEMKFVFDSTETFTTIKARSAAEVAKKIPAVANDIFRAYTLKGMI